MISFGDRWGVSALASLRNESGVDLTQLPPSPAFNNAQPVFSFSKTTRRASGLAGRRILIHHAMHGWIFEHGAVAETRHQGGIRDPYDRRTGRLPHTSQAAARRRQVPRSRGCNHEPGSPVRDGYIWSGLKLVVRKELR